MACPTPVWVALGLSVFARCVGDCMRALWIVWVFGPLPMFSVICWVPGGGVRWEWVSVWVCARCSAHCCVWFIKVWLYWSFGMPRVVRSWLLSVKL